MPVSNFRFKNVSTLHGGVNSGGFSMVPQQQHVCNGLSCPTRPADESMFAQTTGETSGHAMGHGENIIASTAIIIIIISTTMFMVLSSWQSHCESSPGSFDECSMAPSGRRPKTKPDDLGCESACTGCQKLHPPTISYAANIYPAKE